MKRKRKNYPEELAIKAATEYVTTDATIRDIQNKYGFKGVGTLYGWIKKYDLDISDEEAIKIRNIMLEEKEKSPREDKLEKEIETLKKQLEQEKVKVKAYKKMIEIAERDLSISIKKKPGYKQ